MLDICPNCNVPVIAHSPPCKDHRSAESMLILADIPVSNTKKRNAQLKKKAPDLSNRPSLEELLHVVADEFEIEPEELRRKRKGNKKPYPRAKQLFCLVAYDKLRYKTREIAAFLGVTPPAVSNKTVIAREETYSRTNIQKRYDAIVTRVTARSAA